jgi:hypothetical protein
MDSCCYSGDLVDDFPLEGQPFHKHLKELKYAGLIREINPPYIKYCINRKNWETAKELMLSFLNDDDGESQTVKQMNYQPVNPTINSFSHFSHFQINSFSNFQID